MSNIDARVDELESKISYLELANQELSDLVYAQQQQIDKHFHDLAGQLRQIQDSVVHEDAAQDEKPPHY